LSRSLRRRGRRRGRKGLQQGLQQQEVRQQGVSLKQETALKQGLMCCMMMMMMRVCLKLTECRGRQLGSSRGRLPWLWNAQQLGWHYQQQQQQGPVQMLLQTTWRHCWIAL
jgi:hypothetical protein